MEARHTLTEIVKVGDPSSDRWIPLQYDNVNSIKIEEPHRCPNKPYYGDSKDNNHSTDILSMRVRSTFKY